MSEETKIDSDYVTMFDGSGATVDAAPVMMRQNVPDNLDDPNLSQVGGDFFICMCIVFLRCFLNEFRKKKI